MTGLLTYLKRCAKCKAYRPQAGGRNILLPSGRRQFVCAQCK